MTPLVAVLWFELSIEFIKLAFRIRKIIIVLSLLKKFHKYQ